METWKMKESYDEEIVVENNVFLNSVNDGAIIAIDTEHEEKEVQVNMSDQSDDNNNELTVDNNLKTILDGAAYEEMLLFSSADSPVTKRSVDKRTNSPSKAPVLKMRTWSSSNDTMSGRITPPLAESSPKKDYQESLHKISNVSSSCTATASSSNLLTSALNKSAVFKPKMVSVLKNVSTSRNLDNSISNRTSLGNYFANFSPDETTLRRIEPGPVMQEQQIMIVRVDSRPANTPSARVSSEEKVKGQKAQKERQRRSELSESLEELKSLMPRSKIPKRCSVAQTLDHVSMYCLHLNNQRKRLEYVLNFERNRNLLLTRIILGYSKS